MSYIPTRLTRRTVLGGMALVGLVLAFPGVAFARPKVTVYRSPTCDCCEKWADHLVAAGFETEIVNRGGLTALKTQFGVPEALRSCHTGVVDGYIVEGHVPAAEVHRLLKERPDALGLSVPGMPIGSPGMEVGSEKETYDVILFTRGGASTFARYRGSDRIDG